MPTATLSTRVDDWIYSRLDAVNVPAAGGRRFSEDTAPTTVTYPYVQYSMLSGITVGALEGGRILGRYVYIVQAITRSGNYDDVEAASDQIYTALHQQEGSVAGITVLSAICEEEIRRAETTEGGMRWRYLGWRVRLEVIEA